MQCRRTQGGSIAVSHCLAFLVFNTYVIRIASAYMSRGMYDRELIPFALLCEPIPELGEAEGFSLYGVRTGSLSICYSLYWVHCITGRCEGFTVLFSIIFQPHLHHFRFLLKSMLAIY